MSRGSSNLEYETEYRSSITPRTASRGSNRASGAYSPTPHAGGGRILKIVTEMGSTNVSGISPAMSQVAAKSFLVAAENEKKEMQSLNDRLGSYIDRVKGLEAQNRKLVADLENLRGRWGKDTSEIKIKFSGQLSDARKNIDAGAREKSQIEVQISRLQQELGEYKRRFDDVQSARRGDKDKIDTYGMQINDAKTEIDMLLQRLRSLQDEMNRYGNENPKLWDELQKARSDLDEETLARIDFQNQVQTLMEELEFLRNIHDQEVKELQALLNTQPIDTREFFKNELALAIRDIRGEYDVISQTNKSDMESWYKLKVQEVQSASGRQNMENTFQREEVNRMRSGIQDLRAKLGDLEGKNSLLEKQVQELTYQLEDDQRQYETALNDRDGQLRRIREECQALVQELQALLDTKQMLDSEIAIYRTMLQGEESRAGLRQMVEQVVKSHSLQQQEETDSQRHVRGEMSTRTTFQRSAKGNVAIAECEPDGKFIVLENTHRSKDGLESDQEENIGDWKIRRKLDGRREIVFTIPSGTSIKSGRALKIWARGSGGSHNPPHELIFDGEDSWGTGSHIQTSLLNKDGEERATHTQRTVQQGQM